MVTAVQLIPIPPDVKQDCRVFTFNINTGI